MLQVGPGAASRELSDYITEPIPVMLLRRSQPKPRLARLRVSQVLSKKSHIMRI